VQIAERTIGLDSPVFIIAEVSANHNQSLQLAYETITAAAEAGADAVKLQTYTPDTLTFNGDTEPFRVTQGTIWDGRTLYSLYQEGQTPWEWHAELFEHAKSLGLVAFSSPFDPSAVDFLESLQVPAYKVASFEIVDIPLIEQIAALGKPVIISTGIARESDIHLALETCRKVGNDQLILLKCTSAYPALAEELNLQTITDIPSRYGCIPGYSDHTLTNTASVVATALGARVIERHIILNHSIESLDAAFSTSAKEFGQLVQDIREAEAALGSVSYDLSPRMEASREHARSLFVVKDVEQGDLVTRENVRSIRPSAGIHPKYLGSVLGRRFNARVTAGTPLSFELLDETV